MRVRARAYAFRVGFTLFVCVLFLSQSLITSATNVNVNPLGFSNVYATPSSPTAAQAVTVAATATCPSAGDTGGSVNAHCAINFQYAVTPPGGQRTTGGWSVFTPDEQMSRHVSATIGPFARGTQVEAWFQGGSTAGSNVASSHVTWTVMNAPPTVAPSYAMTHTDPMALAPVTWDFAEGDNDFVVESGSGATYDDASGSLLVQAPNTYYHVHSSIGRDLDTPFTGDMDRTIEVRFSAQYPGGNPYFEIIHLKGESGDLAIQLHGGLLTAEHMYCNNAYNAPTEGRLVLRYLSSANVFNASIFDLTGALATSCQGAYLPGWRGTGTKPDFTHLSLDEVDTSGGGGYFGSSSLSAHVWSISDQITLRKHVVRGDVLHLVANDADADGDARTVQWTLDDGTLRTGTAIDVPLTTFGEGGAQVRAVDSQGAASDLGSLSWIVPNGLPSLVVPARVAGPAGSAIAFDGSASADADGPSPLSLAWTFGDGASANGLSVSHAYAAAGHYRAHVVATDGEDSVASDVPVVVTSSDPSLIVSDGTEVYDFNASDEGFRPDHDVKNATLGVKHDGSYHVDATGNTTIEAIAETPLASTFDATTPIRAQARFRVDDLSPGGSLTALALMSPDAYSTTSPGTLRLGVTRPAGAALAQTFVTLRSGSGGRSDLPLAIGLTPGMTYTLAAETDPAAGTLKARLYDTDGHLLSEATSALPSGPYTFTRLALGTGPRLASASMSIDQITLALGGAPVGYRDHAYRLETTEARSDATTYDWRLGNDGAANAQPAVLQHAFATLGVQHVTVAVPKPDGTVASIASDLSIVNAPPTAIADVNGVTGLAQATFETGYDGFLLARNIPGYSAALQDGDLVLAATGGSATTATALAKPLPATLDGSWSYRGDISFRPRAIGAGTIDLLELENRTYDQMSAQITPVGFRLHVDLRNPSFATAQDLCASEVHAGVEYRFAFDYSATTSILHCTLSVGTSFVAAESSLNMSSASMRPNVMIGALTITMRPMATATPTVAAIHSLRFAYGPAEIAVGQSVRLSAARSADADRRDSLADTWTLPDGSHVTGASTTFTPTTAGYQVATLAVSDGHDTTSVPVPIAVAATPSARVTVTPDPTTSTVLPFTSSAEGFASRTTTTGASVSYDSTNGALLLARTAGASGDASWARALGAPLAIGPGAPWWRVEADATVASGASGTNGTLMPIALTVDPGTSLTSALQGVSWRVSSRGQLATASLRTPAGLTTIASATLSPGVAYTFAIASADGEVEATLLQAGQVVAIGRVRAPSMSLTTTLVAVEPGASTSTATVSVDAVRYLGLAPAILTGQPIAFHLDITGAPGAPVHWDFGDGTGADGLDVSHTYARAGSPLVAVTALTGALPSLSAIQLPIASTQPITVLQPSPVAPGATYALNERPSFPGSYGGTQLSVDGGAPIDLPARGDISVPTPAVSATACLRSTTLTGSPLTTCAGVPLATPLPLSAFVPVDGVHVVRFGAGVDPNNGSFELRGRVLVETPPALKPFKDTLGDAIAQGATIILVDTLDPSLLNNISDDMLRTAWSYGITIFVPAGDVPNADYFSITGPAASPFVITVGAATRQGVESWSARGPTLGFLEKPDLVAPTITSSTVSAVETAATMALALELKGIRDPQVVKAMLLGLTLPVRSADVFPDAMQQGAGLLDPLCLGFNLINANVRVTLDAQTRLSTSCTDPRIPTLRDAYDSITNVAMGLDALDAIDVSVIGSASGDLGVNLVIGVPILPAVLNADFGVVNDRLPKPSAITVTDPNLALNVTLNTSIDPVSGILAANGIQMGDIHIELRQSLDVTLNTTLYHEQTTPLPIFAGRLIAAGIGAQTIEDNRGLLSQVDLVHYLSLLPKAPRDPYYIVDEVDQHMAPPQNISFRGLCGLRDHVVALADSASKTTLFHSAATTADGAAGTAALFADSLKLSMLGDSLRNDPCKTLANTTRYLAENVTAAQATMTSLGIQSQEMSDIADALRGLPERLDQLLALDVGELDLKQPIITIQTNDTRTRQSPLGDYGGFLRITSHGVCLELSTALINVSCRDMSFYVPANLKLVGTLHAHLKFRDDQGAPVVNSSVDAYGSAKREFWISLPDFERRTTDPNGTADFKFLNPGSWYFRGFYDFGIEFDNWTAQTHGRSRAENVPMVRSNEQSATIAGAQGGDAGLPGACGSIGLIGDPEIINVDPATPFLGCTLLNGVPIPALSDILGCMPLQLPVNVLQNLTSYLGHPKLMPGVTLDLPQASLDCIAHLPIEVHAPDIPRESNLTLVAPAAAITRANDDVSFYDTTLATWNLTAQQQLLGTGAWNYTIRDGPPMPPKTASDAENASAVFSGNANRTGRTLDARRDFLLNQTSGSVDVPNLGIIDYVFPLPDAQYLRTNIAFNATFTNADGWLILSDGAPDHDNAISIISDWIGTKKYDLRAVPSLGENGIRVVALSSQIDLDCEAYSPQAPLSCYEEKVSLMNQRGFHQYTFSTEYSTIANHPKTARMTLLLAPIPDLSNATSGNTTRMSANVTIDSLHMRIFGFDTTNYASKSAIDSNGFRDVWRYAPNELTKMEDWDTYVSTARVDPNAYRFTRVDNGTQLTNENPGGAYGTDYTWDAARCGGGNVYAVGCSEILGHLPQHHDHAHMLTSGGLHQDLNFDWAPLNTVQERITAGDDVGGLTGCARGRQTGSGMRERFGWVGYTGISPNGDRYTGTPGTPLTDRYYDDFSSGFYKSFGVDYYALRNVGLDCVNGRGGLFRDFYKPDDTLLVCGERGQVHGKMMGGMKMASMLLDGVINGPLDCPLPETSDIIPRGLNIGGNGIPLKCLIDLRDLVYSATKVNIPDFQLPICPFYTSYVNRDPGDVRASLSGNASNMWHAGIAVLSRQCVMTDRTTITKNVLSQMTWSHDISPTCERMPAGAYPNSTMRYVRNLTTSASTTGTTWSWTNTSLYLADMGLVNATFSEKADAPITGQPCDGHWAPATGAPPGTPYLAYNASWAGRDAVYECYDPVVHKVKEYDGGGMDSLPGTVFTLG